MNYMPKAAMDQAEPPELCSRTVAGTLHGSDGTSSDVSWHLAQEMPIALQINSAPYTVMMATPADLRDFAVGFLVSEGIVADTRHIKGVLVMPVDGGIAVDIAVDAESVDSSRLVRRAIEGRSGCGLCGVEDIAAAIRPLPVLAREAAPSLPAIQKAAAALAAHQPMNRLNRSVHAAAWASHSGDIRLAREDVGRHNALDKLIGALSRMNADPSDGFVMMTSRCSYELVQKTVNAGIGALVTVSAPTALAYELAVKSNLFLAALAPQGIVVFNP